MRLARFIGGLSLLFSTAGCCCGSCGWGSCGPAAPATYQAATPQYGTAGTYASTPTGAPLGSSATAGGMAAPVGMPQASSTIGATASPGGSNVEPASYTAPVSP